MFLNGTRATLGPQLGLKKKLCVFVRFQLFGTSTEFVTRNTGKTRKIATITAIIICHCKRLLPDNIHVHASMQNSF